MIEYLNIMVNNILNNGYQRILMVNIVVDNALNNG